DVKTWLNNTDRFNGLEGYHLDPVASRMGRKVYKETRQAGSVIRTSGVFGAGSTGLVIIIEDVKGIRGKANRAIATFDDCRY
ncbi:hypothetical protein, partial [Klebsiella pneumoniae]|uniref:hypothetical protein n=1 Tax=Klebsiella pneumoniae TaxID=573 RepID=UPI00272FF1D5